MTKTVASQKRNVEHIRQKNLEDNRLFLEKLLMNNIRKDFLSSARSVLRKSGADQIKKSSSRPHQRVERVTRYSEKVKSGEILPHIPEWQRDIERKQLEKEQKRQEKELQRQQKEMERQQKLQEIEMEKEELLFERELKKVESGLKFEELVQMRRAERQRRHGPSKWELYQDQSHPNQLPYKLRHASMDEQIDQEHL